MKHQVLTSKRTRVLASLRVTPLLCLGLIAKLLSQDLEDIKTVHLGYISMYCYVISLIR